MKAPARATMLEASLERFAALARGLQASAAIPCAGPVVLLGPKGLTEETRAALQRPDGLYDRPALLERLARAAPSTAILPLDPGAEAPATPEGRAAGFLRARTEPLSRREATFEALLAARTAAGALPTAPASADPADLALRHGAFLRRLRQASPTFSAGITISWTLHFPDLGIRFEMEGLKGPLVAKGPRDLAPLAGTPAFQHHVLSGLWSLLLDDRIDFDELYYSQRYRLEQTDSGYSGDLVTLLRAAGAPLMLEAIEADARRRPVLQSETMTVRWNGVDHRLRRRCPHLGGDLQGCVPDPQGRITCPMHGWVFDVASGRCLFGDVTRSIAAAEASTP